MIAVVLDSCCYVVESKETEQMLLKEDYILLPLYNILYMRKKIQG
jgi:hypothetical protein